MMIRIVELMLGKMLRVMELMLGKMLRVTELMIGKAELMIGKAELMIGKVKLMIGKVVLMIGKKVLTIGMQNTLCVRGWVLMWLRGRQCLGCQVLGPRGWMHLLCLRPKLMSWRHWRCQDRQVTK